MRRAFAATCALALALGLAACQPRSEPYRFRSPLVGSVSAANIEPGAPRAREPDSGPVAVRDRPQLSAAEALATAMPPSEPAGLADELRRLVGVRDGDSTHVRFALDVLVHLGVDLDADLRGADRGTELLALARARDALDEGPPLLGDLVVFDAVEGDEPASLIGVVVASDRGGTVELIHLTRGIVRRSFVNPRRRSETRDDDGYALNTFLRPGRPGDAAGTRYLAGELFATVSRIDRLAQAR
jgi:hypothetical protein